MLAKIAAMTAELRNLKQFHDTCTDPDLKESTRKNIARTLHSLGRANTHLSTLKVQIRAENIRIHKNQQCRFPA